MLSIKIFNGYFFADVRTSYTNTPIWDGQGP